MKGEIGKVTAYITSGRRLLVFRHTQFPEAGIQVPSGTLEEDEQPETAVLREAFEETGLQDLRIVGYLGARRHDLTQHGRWQTELRYYFHLSFDGQTPPCWRHWEESPSEGMEERIEFELYWVSWPEEIPILAGRQGALLDRVAWDGPAH